MITTAFVPSEAYAEATAAPGDYNTPMIVGFAVAVIIGIVGLIIGAVGGCICVKPLIDKAARDEFDNNDELSDIFDED